MLYVKVIGHWFGHTSNDSVEYNVSSPTTDQTVLASSNTNSQSEGVHVCGSMCKQILTWSPLDRAIPLSLGSSCSNVLGCWHL